MFANVLFTRIVQIVLLVNNISVLVSGWLNAGAALDWAISRKRFALYHKKRLVRPRGGPRRLFSRTCRGSNPARWRPFAGYVAYLQRLRVYALSVYLGQDGGIRGLHSFVLLDIGLARSRRKARILADCNQPAKTKSFRFIADACAASVMSGQ